MDDQTPVKPNKTTVRMMIILIILLLIGIATRWKYIEKEIVDVTRGCSIRRLLPRTHCKESNSQ